MEKVVFSLAVRDYFDHLVFSLFHKEYFSRIENAKRYVDNIVDFIINGIHTFPHKETPFPIKRYGEFYIFYQANKRTTWYIFFENRKNKYIVTHILNNHCEEVRFL